MCPLRFILVFISALLAAYLAWKTTVKPQENITSYTTKHNNLFKTTRNGFWGLVEMASGRYLWTNVKQFINNQEA
ncbi:hypothetical protein ACS0TY_033626 [Phlomoides rotata]